MAVISPIWNIIYSPGLLMGIGGSVLFNTLRGKAQENQHRSNEYFTAAVIGVDMLALILFDRELLALFGAEDSLMPLARRYVLPAKFFVPLFLFSQLLSAFLRSDGSPGLAARAVLLGGLFNVLGDYVLVFVLNLGILGAGLATCLGCLLSVGVMLTHFFSPRCTLRLVRPARLWRMLGKITMTGFSTFFIDVAMGILTVLFNSQFSVTWTPAPCPSTASSSTSTPSCSAALTASARRPSRSSRSASGRGASTASGRRSRYALFTAAVFGLIWTALCLLVPNLFTRIFMQPTKKTLSIVPTIIRRYGLSFPLLPFNIFSTYYFQALLRPQAAFAVSVGRVAAISGVLILLLPAVAGADALWFAMPVTEAVTAVYMAWMMARYSRAPEASGA
ncbi:MAG: MATE family efflux transporter [Aristaeellaceae bacterium]